ncbi:hypothetical protein BJ170DRAFT_599616 [Xylariales sp. AK1849]|nr:hypothetical protein BJ170DRAFT_599616 [Xylariales sp. AK1849]
MALFVSLIVFYLLPFLIFFRGTCHVIEIIQLTAAISWIITWSLLLLACIRYERWTRSCAEELKAQGLERFISGSESYKAWNVLSWLQPWTARLALAGCLFVFVCLSAPWWTAEVSFAKVAAAYGAIFYKSTKLWVHLEIETRPRDLIKRLRYLERLSRKGEDRMKPRLNPSGPGEVSRQDAMAAVEPGA